MSHIICRTTSESIADGDVFERLGAEPPPQGVRLEGPPGAGKTTYLRHIVHTWSSEFLRLYPDDHIVTPLPKWTLMVYIPAREIEKSKRESKTVTQAISDHLWCDVRDKETLMRHVMHGRGVGVLIDAIDEVRDPVVITHLRAYVHKVQTNGGPTFLVSSRSDLCFVPPDDFCRYLVLEGFTPDQGEEFVRRHFSLDQQSASS